jgi:glycine/D-amino acid oxidase-like deaminating enzyme
MRRVLGLIAAVTLVATGCDRAGKVPVYPVRGQVFYDGKPAAGVQVYLFPTAAPGIPDIPTNPHGITGPDGRFALGTYSEEDGAADGSYQVVLIWPPENKGGEEHQESNQDRLLGWYTVARSKLTAIIPQSGVELPPFKLPVMKTSPSETSVGIPGRN